MIFYLNQVPSQICCNLASNFLIMLIRQTKQAPEKNFFMLPTVKYLGHELGFDTIKSISSKIAATHKLFSPTKKIELMTFIGSMNFYSKPVDKLHVKMKPMYDLLHDYIEFNRNNELETLFQQYKSSSTKNVNLTLPNTILLLF